MRPGVRPTSVPEAEDSTPEGEVSGDDTSEVTRGGPTARKASGRGAAM